MLATPLVWSERNQLMVRDERWIARVADERRWRVIGRKLHGGRRGSTCAGCAQRDRVGAVRCLRESADREGSPTGDAAHVYVLTAVAEQADGWRSVGLVARGGDARLRVGRTPSEGDRVSGDPRRDLGGEACSGSGWVVEADGARSQVDVVGIRRADADRRVEFVAESDFEPAAGCDRDGLVEVAARAEIEGRGTADVGKALRAEVLTARRLVEPADHVHARDRCRAGCVEEEEAGAEARDRSRLGACCSARICTRRASVGLGCESVRHGVAVPRDRERPSADGCGRQEQRTSYDQCRDGAIEGKSRLSPRRLPASMHNVPVRAESEQPGSNGNASLPTGKGIGGRP